MGKRLIVKGADFQTNRIPSDVPQEMIGTTVNEIWVRDGTSFNTKPIANYQVVYFEVNEGDSYYIETDKTSSAIAFTDVIPAVNVSYITGQRYLAYPNQPLNGTVPAGAKYVAFGKYAPDGGNLFPSVATFGIDYIDCSKYR